MVDITSAENFFPERHSPTRSRALQDATRMLDLAARAGRRLEERLNGALLAAGLSAAQGRALRVIAAEPGLTVGELTARLGISKQSLAPVLKTLSRRGLVTATGTHTDRRRRLMRLTAEGEAAWYGAARGALGLLAAAFADTGPAGASGFQAVLLRLAELAECEPAASGKDES